LLILNASTINNAKQHRCFKLSFNLIACASGPLQFSLIARYENPSITYVRYKRSCRTRKTSAYLISNFLPIIAARI